MDYIFLKSKNMEIFQLDSEFDTKLCVEEVGYNSRVNYGKGIQNYAIAHQIHFVIDGAGRIDGIPVKSHMGFYVPQGSTYIESSDKSGMEQCWINICGDESEGLLEKIGITADNRIFDFNNTAPEIISAIKEIYTLRESLIDKFYMLGLLFKLMSYIQRPANEIYQCKLKYVLKAEEYVRRNYKGNITVADIAAELNLSPKYLSRIYTAARGYTLVSYITTTRMKSAMLLLRRSNDSIGNIARECGYSDPLYFSKAFHRCFNVTPTEYRSRPFDQ